MPTHVGGNLELDFLSPAMINDSITGAQRYCIIYAKEPELQVFMLGYAAGTPQFLVKVIFVGTHFVLQCSCLYVHV